MIARESNLPQRDVTISASILLEPVSHRLLRRTPDTTTCRLCLTARRSRVSFEFPLFSFFCSHVTFAARARRLFIAAVPPMFFRVGDLTAAPRGCTVGRPFVHLREEQDTTSVARRRCISHTPFAVCSGRCGKLCSRERA